MSGENVELQVILIADQPQELEIFLNWADQVALDIDALSNSGCGCCVDIYEFSTSLAAARRLDERLRAVGSGVNFKT